MIIPVAGRVLRRDAKLELEDLLFEVLQSAFDDFQDVIHPLRLGRVWLDESSRSRHEVLDWKHRLPDIAYSNGDRVAHNASLELRLMCQVQNCTRSTNFRTQQGYAQAAVLARVPYSLSGWGELWESETTLPPLLTILDVGLGVADQDGRTARSDTSSALLARD